MGPNLVEPPNSSQSNDQDSTQKDEQVNQDDRPKFDPDHITLPDHEIEALLTPSSIRLSPVHPSVIDPDLLPVAPALIINVLAITPVDRSGGRTPIIPKKSSWPNNENSFPLDGFVSFDSKFYPSKLPKPVWPKTHPTIPTSFFKDHLSKKKVGKSLKHLL